MHRCSKLETMSWCLAGPLTCVTVMLNHDVQVHTEGPNFIKYHQNTKLHVLVTATDKAGEDA